MNHEHEDRHSHDSSHAPEATRDHGRGHPIAAHTGSAPHDTHAGHSTTAFRDKFWISLLLTFPTLIWGHMLQDVGGYTAPTVPGSHWIPPSLEPRSSSTVDGSSSRARCESSAIACPG